ncbi:MAG: InlB B-repeat-containing protein, partial [Clostridia bacterium]|nr:InlB B-repeat-containing protein [Clostridia bacterium]
MKRNRTMKRLLAMLLTIVLTTVCLPAQVLAEALTPSGDPADSANAVTAQSAAPEGDAAEETTVYYEVSFARPGSATAEEAEKTTLPETQMLPAGTALASIATPRQIGSVFLGWYYDEALTRMAGPNDTVGANLTLYARFGIREDLEGEYATDYIAVEDVAPEYRVLVSAHNLTADDIRGRLAVRDVSRGGEAIDFTVEEVVEEQPEPVPEEPFSLDALALDEETRAGVEELVQRKASNPEYALGAALRELELDPETVDAILKGCAPEEYEAEQSVNWMDADMMVLAETAGLSGDFSGLLDLNAVYGLEDDDSPERYWREELELEPEQVLL